MTVGVQGFPAALAEARAERADVARIDVLGDEFRAQIVTDHLRNVQARLFELGVIRLKESLGDSDPVPGEPLLPDGTVVSFRYLNDKLEAAQEALLSRYGDILGI